MGSGKEYSPSSFAPLTPKPLLPVRVEHDWLAGPSADTTEEGVGHVEHQHHIMARPTSRNGGQQPVRQGVEVLSGHRRQVAAVHPGPQRASGRSGRPLVSSPVAVTGAALVGAAVLASAIDRDLVSSGDQPREHGGEKGLVPAVCRRNAARPVYTNVHVTSRQGR
jgi:hypothetical protein